METSEQPKVIGPAPRALESPAPALSLDVHTTIQDALDMLEASSLPALPILNPRTGEPGALLVRPGSTVLVNVAGLDERVSPRLGGLATPLGVYLHDGQTGGGAGFWGLVTTGFIFGMLGVAAEIPSLFLTLRLDRWVVAGMAHSPVLGLRAPVDIWISQMLVVLLSMFLVMLLVRILPLSGTHAAEHQVVHSVEQGVPLTLRHVRAMPRVHPRCGTNFLVGMLLFIVLFVTGFELAQVENVNDFYAAALAALVAAPVALKYWRRAGSFVQYWLATKPATDRQIVSAICAATQVLERRKNVCLSDGKFLPLRRLWAIGIPQVSVGYGLVYLMLQMIKIYWPSLGAALEM